MVMPHKHSEPPGMGDRLQAEGRFSLAADALYLDCAAQGPRLHAVLAAGHAMLDAGTSPWALSYDEQEIRIEALRASMAQTLFDGDADGMALVPSAAYGLATAASNLGLAAGDAVLVLDSQFPSNLLPWQQRCAATSARIVVARRVAGQDWTDTVLATIDAEPCLRIVAVEHAHWHDGALLDLDRVAQRTRAAGAALVLDLSQSLGALPVDLARWQPDFIAAVGYKWLLGPAGLAWLWVAPRWRDEGIAIEQHWSARDAEVWQLKSDHRPRHRPGARRFDAGGVTDPLRVAMATTALDQLKEWGLANISLRLGQLTAEFDRALDAHGLDTWKTHGHAPHFTALRAPDEDQLEAAAGALRRERVICTRRAGLLRIAPHLHVDEEDMQRVARILAGAVQR